MQNVICYDLSLVEFEREEFGEIKTTSKLYDSKMMVNQINHASSLLNFTSLSLSHFVQYVKLSLHPCQISRYKLFLGRQATFF